MLAAMPIVEHRVRLEEMPLFAAINVGCRVCVERGRFLLQVLPIRAEGSDEGGC
jgi:hypothetical protein